MSDKDDGASTKRSSSATHTLRSIMIISFGALVISVVAAVTLAITFGLPFLGYQGLYGAELEFVRQNLGLVAEQKKERLLQWIDERKGDARVLANGIALEVLVRNLHVLVQSNLDSGTSRSDLRALLLRSESNKEVMKRLQIFVRAYDVYTKVQVVDASAGLVLASTAPDDVGGNVADGSLVKEILKKPSEASIDLVVASDGTNPYLAVGRGIGREWQTPGVNKGPLGLIIIYVATDDFIAPLLYTGNGLGSSGDVVLVDRQLRSLISLKFPFPNGIQAKPLKHRITTEPARLAASGKEGICESSDYRNVAVLAAYRHIQVTPDYSWGLVVKRDKDEVFRNLRRGVINSLFIGCVGIAVAGLIGSVVARKIAGPIEKLSLAARQVEAGSLKADSPASKIKEVNALAESFNSMLKYLRSWHQELDRQVRERSGELLRVNAELHGEVQERKRMEEELRVSGQRYRTLFENMNDCVAIYRAVNDGEDFVFVDFNRAGERTDKIERDQLIGKSLLEMFPGMQEFGLFQMFQRVWRTGVPENHPMTEYKDDRIAGWRKNFVYKLPTGDLVAVYSDETERKQAADEIFRLNMELEERVKQRTKALDTANKELESFAYSVSHDLRAPLRAIHGFAQIIATRHRSALNTEGRHYVDNVVLAGEQMELLINDLLMYSRLGRKAVRQDPVQLEEVVSQAISHLAAQIEETHAEIIVQKDLPVFRGDFSLAMRAFQNLLGNALTYRLETVKPRIEITAETDGDFVTIRISDNGIGIPPEFQEKVFLIFQRLHNQDQYPGTGIGLAVVKKSVEMLGGFVSLTSTVGQGSTFSLRLPRSFQ